MIRTSTGSSDTRGLLNFESKWAFPREGSTRNDPHTIAPGQGATRRDFPVVIHFGRARLKVDDEERVVGPGSVLYVGGTSEHSFVEIEEDTTLLVFFASGGPSAD
jgi:hypothetical protein